jgi:hypothetical protein
MTTNLTNTTDEILNNNLSLHSETIFDPDELLISMKNSFTEITHVEINKKLESTKTSFKFNRINTTNENNCVLSNDKLFTNNSRTKQNSDNEISSSDERSFAKIEQNNQGNLSDENVHHYYFQTPSSTTSGRSSSSISSVQNENTIITPESNGNFQSNSHSPTTKTYKSQFGLFSRIFGTKSSQNLSIDTHKNSKTCAIM